MTSITLLIIGYAVLSAAGAMFDRCGQIRGEKFDAARYSQASRWDWRGHGLLLVGMSLVYIAGLYAAWE